MISPELKAVFLCAAWPSKFDEIADDSWQENISPVLVSVKPKRFTFVYTRKVRRKNLIEVKVYYIQHYFRNFVILMLGI